MKLVDLIEGYFARFPTEDRMGRPITADIYKNPTRKELNYVHSTYAVQGDDVPGMIDPQGNLFIWTPYLLHYKIYESKKLPANCIGIRIYYDASECSVSVTDFTKHSSWDHNPETPKAIFNSYLSKLFQIVDITYYDDA